MYIECIDVSPQAIIFMAGAVAIIAITKAYMKTSKKEK